MTTLEQVSGLYEIAEYMDDPELTQALEFVAKAILKPDIPPQVAVVELVRLQAIATKCSMRATYMANVDKSDRAKKNLYFTAAKALDDLVSALKYTMR